MCLSTVTERLQKLDHTERWGWKVFDKWGKELQFQWHIPPACRDGMVYDSWLKSQDDKSEAYPLGFHVFATRTGARDWSSLDHSDVIVKVRFRKVVAIGAQQGFKCYVAREMYIPKPAGRA